ncbi:hypothetical protein SAURM35S_00103 [Streptomyces aurantiogriseus]
MVPHRHGRARSEDHAHRRRQRKPTAGSGANSSSLAGQPLWSTWKIPRTTIRSAPRRSGHHLVGPPPHPRTHPHRPDRHPHGLLQQARTPVRPGRPLHQARPPHGSREATPTQAPPRRTPALVHLPRPPPGGHRPPRRPPPPRPPSPPLRHRRRTPRPWRRSLAGTRSHAHGRTPRPGREPAAGTPDPTGRLPGPPPGRATPTSAPYQAPGLTGPGAPAPVPELRRLRPPLPLPGPRPLPRLPIRSPRGRLA